MGSDCTLRGVSTHNLKEIDVVIPLYAFTTVTGVSGSGKSSLVFDTLYAESYRRYLESLSSFARQYLQALPKPATKEVLNLPPSIAVRQSRKGTGNRSTVGTITEVNDLLQVLFEHLCETYCTGCGDQLTVTRPGALARSYVEDFAGQTVVISAGTKHWDKLKSTEVVKWLLSQGYRRFQSHLGESSKLDDLDLKKVDFFKGRVILDRLKVSDSSLGRIEQSFRAAALFGRGSFAVSLDSMKSWTEHFDRLICGKCGIEYRDPSPAIFTFNHPLGACELCQGYGKELVIDWEKVIPDLDASLARGAIAPFQFSDHVRYQSVLETAAKAKNYSLHKKISLFSDHQMKWLKFGDGKKFQGVKGYFDWLDTKKHRPHYRIHRLRYSKYVTCTGCLGGRLGKTCQAYKLDHRTFGQWQSMSLDQLLNKVNSIDMDQHQSRLKQTMWEVVAEAMQDLQSRIGFLQQVGLGYLSLERSSRTLSGGELQRIHLARCLGSRLTDTLYCLDEPSAGLHPKDRDRLLKLIFELRDRGNTIVCVEHDRRFFEVADHHIQIGPGAGHKGGEVVYSGRPKHEKAARSRLRSDSCLDKNLKYVELIGARLHNLDRVSCRLPLGKMTAVCGVSGSGKSTLILQSLVPLWKQRLGLGVDVPDEQKPLLGTLKFPKGVESTDCVHVSQAPLARSSRSNIATYVKAYDRIRRHFAEKELAKELGLSPGAFSFNVPGGRCETCSGLGRVTEDLSFLGEMEVECPDCQGKRFSESVLSVQLEGKNLIQILSLTVEEAADFFWFDPKIARLMKPLLDLGLGYLPVGQSTSTLSGGESQRLKLAPVLAARDSQPTCFVFDEPTTGLSDSDVKMLMSIFRHLCKQGHTVVVVEHHLEVIAGSDYVIEIGPGANLEGGKVVYQGLPENLPKVENSATGPYLVF